jgi:hypothetical protein
MASTYLQRTQVSATNRKKMTLSMWFKTSEQGSRDYQLWETYASPTDRITMYIDSSDQMHWYDPYENVDITTNRKFRDTSGWYHIVWQIDTTESTASNRIKLYVNGVQETSFSTANYYSLNADTASGTASYTNYIGKYGGNTNNDFNGSMSHIHFIDGTAYQASDFGSTDSTTGEWKINTSPSVTYGNNGFFILKDGNSVTDQSGNSNNFTVGAGTLTNTEDNPSNVFATMNPLIPSNGSFSEGNNTITTSSSSWCTIGGNLGATSGKYYWEVKMNLLSGSTTSFYTMIGFARLQGNSSDLGSNLTSNLGDNNGVGIYSDNGSLYHPGGTISYTSGFKTSGNIIGVALDLDNNYAYWSINGTWQNSGDPTSGATGTGGYDLSSFADGSFIVPASSVQNYASANQSENEYNFGNGYFGTTAVSSAGTNASGNGIFEYDVPTGFTALSTKGLNL